MSELHFDTEPSTLPCHPHLHRAALSGIATLAFTCAPGHAREPVVTPAIARDAAPASFTSPAYANANRSVDVIGEHTIVDTRSGRVHMRARVELSSRGLRASNLLDGRQAIMNFAQGRYWFVDRSRRMVHEVPMSVWPSAAPSPGPFPGPSIDQPVDRAVDSSPDTLRGTPGVSSAPAASAAPAVGARVVSGVFASEPCHPLHIGAVSTTRWRGRQVRLIDCLDDTDALQAIHYHDPALHMVIRSVDRDGIAEEFTDVTVSRIDDSRFVPPLQFDRVDAATFAATRPTLSAYRSPGVD